MIKAALRRTAAKAVLHRSLRSIWGQGLLVALACAVVYLFTKVDGNPYRQYVLLADALVDGRLHIVDPAPWLELARTGEGAYVIDPPAPVLFHLPLVPVFGTDYDQTLVSVAVGAAAVGLVWVAARTLWSRGFALLMTVLVGLGTNLWWASTDGALWTFAHVSAVFFSMGALVVAVRGGHPLWVGVLVGLAGLSRLPVFLSAPFFAWLVYERRFSREVARQRLVRPLALFATGVGVFAVIYLGYNLARFGTPFDAGYFHEQYTDKPWFAEGLFDLSYVPRHLHTILFAAPEFRESFPYFHPSTFGVGLFLTTPAFLYAFRARLGPRTVAAVVSIGLVAVPILTYGATGWGQFGYRFALDWLPMLVLLTASGMREEVAGRKIAVVGLAVLANLWGVLSFNVFDWTV